MSTGLFRIKLKKRVALSQVTTKQTAIKGFTLTEMLVAVAILGILSGFAIPAYISNIHKTCQTEVANILSILSSTVSSYKDINGIQPATWLDLSEVTVVMTEAGPANADDGNLTEAITTPACDYTISKSSDDPSGLFTFTASPDAETGEKAEFNAMSCIDLNNGASDLKLGRRDAEGAVTAEALTCRRES
ncbi:type II secretion system protein [Synechococcus sp. KORDI-100]|uniref:type II secretion system protein n=1 Tax=Synechococcus sp. KORDI-100 TaxID=1280380 RepID=UPI00138E151D|nr:prepilin-type N-terminal cleavage/methylation domain-containing protein [Synechococcus sp. KORDI-100]